MPRKPKHKRLRNSIHQARWNEQPALVVELAWAYLPHHPHDATVWLSLGHALTRLSRYEEAEQALSVELARGFETLQPLFWRERGELEQRRGQLEKARTWFERALEADPQQEDLRGDLGTITLRLGELEEAERHFRCALETADFESRHVDLCRLAEALLAQGRLEEAASCFREAAALQPSLRIIKRRLRELEQVLVLRLIQPR